MAVLHHAFRCAVTPAFEQTVRDLAAAWEAADRDRLSAMAIGRYAALGEREDVHAAFYLAPDGAALSWLQPQFISPGLAALVSLAKDFVPIPSLSASNDTNHHRLATQLPALRWSADEINFLVHGQPIETMLRHFVGSGVRLDPGQFRHTGGWTPPAMAQRLREKLDQLAKEGAPNADKIARAAWESLNESKALDDARKMVAALNDDDWLVMAITH
jgi:hypothetical protein